MDREKVINGLEVCRDQDNPPGYRFTSCVDDCPYHGNGCAMKLKEDAIELLKEQEDLGTELTNAVELIHKKNERIEKLLKEQEARIQKYEYVFDFLGIGLRQWTTKILNGEAEAICETDEHEHKTVVTFKLI